MKFDVTHSAAEVSNHSPIEGSNGNPAQASVTDGINNTPNQDQPAPEAADFSNLTPAQLKALDVLLTGLFYKAAAKETGVINPRSGAGGSSLPSPPNSRAGNRKRTKPRS